MDFHSLLLGSTIDNGTIFIETRVATISDELMIMLFVLSILIIIYFNIYFIYYSFKWIFICQELMMERFLNS